MKSLLNFLVLLVVCLVAIPAGGQDYYDTDPPGLKHWMTEEELARKDEIGKGFVASDFPAQPLALSEFGRKLGVLIRYPFGISYSLIREMSLHAKVYTIVANQSQENTVRANYAANNVNLSNCEFIYAPTNSYWTRDYGPFFIAEGDDRISVVNFPYNRPRPQDDQIPIHVANYFGMNYYNMNIVHTGGNYMTDGMGIAASTTLVWTENPSLTPEQINQTFQNYLGIHTYHVVPDPNNTYINHIDCWAKFLDVDKILIRSVPPSHPQYQAIEAAAAYWTQQTSGYGTPYQVFRVNTPNNEPYTNSLILNNKVFVPIMGNANDQPALSVYQQAMPGYTILGFTGSWLSTDAIHCRTKEIPDPGMLHIRHIPLRGLQPERNTHTITAEIIPYSKQPLKNDSLLIHYSFNGTQYYQSVLVSIGGKKYSGTIPFAPVGTTVRYYLSAADQSNRREKHPFIGQADPHTFTIAPTHKHYITLNSNWTGISTHLIPFDQLQQIFAPVTGQLILVQRGTDLWWPSMGVNTLTRWNEKDCLLVKTIGSVQIEVLALQQASKTFQLKSGWNNLPVLSATPVSVEQLFNNWTNQVIIVKEMAGWRLWWPEQQINTIGQLIPGRAYQVKVTQPFQVVFP